MKNYGIVKAKKRPQEIEITSSAVFVASNIQQYTENIDGTIIEGYKYNLIEYSKDEYLLSLAEELSATKILLGVE